MVRCTGPRCCAWAVEMPGPAAQVPSARARAATAARAPIAARAEVVLFIFVIFVCGNCIVLVIVTFCVHGGQFQRVAGDYLEIASTFIALDHFAFVYIIDVDVQRVIALRAYN